MNRKEKKHHHFVPKVYLSKFHHTQKTKRGKKNFFVSIFDKIQNEENLAINIKDICAKNRLYTIDSQNLLERDRIENFYADTFERDYNKFYNILTNSSQENITIEERELIICTVVNLHLRNYFWYKKLNQFWDKLIDRFSDGGNDIVFDENHNILFDFSSQSKDEIKDDNRLKNKLSFIKSQLEQTEKWTKFHFNDVIIVESIVNRKDRLITSDRPVITSSINSSLRLPLDSKNMLTLNPKINEFKNNMSQIYRMEAQNPAIIYNTMAYEMAERLIIGYDINDIYQSKINFEKEIAKK